MKLQRPQTQLLLNWYTQVGRELPWRETKDPYKIWISEIMLQQTTVTAVKPFFERFLIQFPDVQTLSKASLPEVLQAWSGLGYYSRARNLHKSAQVISESGFPNSYKEMLNLPGLGPYTARAVASFAFSEPVGVLDGNVIRFLSRYYGLKIEWWRPKEREKLQRLSDEWVQGFDSHSVNQALIEIGATSCTANSPKCTTCPLIKFCASVGTDLIDALPIAKPKKSNEIWLWNIFIIEKNNKIALIKNEASSNFLKKSRIAKKKIHSQKSKSSQAESTLPVLKNQWIWPGSARRVKAPPKQFSFQHAVTHHKIFVKVNYLRSNALSKQLGQIKWFKKSELKKINPASLVNKALAFSKKNP